jgi:LysR family glycine cleavage system transcriptional activator
MQKLPPLNAVKVFYVASQLKSFTKAAAKLHVTQGAVSRQIKLLEEWVGLPLFLRQHQELVLTAAGRAFADDVGKAFAHLEEGVRNLQPSRLHQRLLLNAPNTFASRWLAPKLWALHKKHGALDLRITTNLVSTAHQAQQYDCCIVFQSGPWLHGQCQLLYLEEHIVVASPQLLQAKRQIESGNATLLHLLNSDGSRLPVWDNWLIQSTHPPVDDYQAITFSTLDQAIHAAVAGAGVALVDRLMVQTELANGSLVRVDESTLVGPFGYWLVQTDRRAAESPVHDAMVKALHDWLLSQSTLALDNMAA